MTGRESNDSGGMGAHFDGVDPNEIFAQVIISTTVECDVAIN